jgi:hypothetical protein
MEGAFRGELAARYETDVSREKQAFSESATTRGLDLTASGQAANIAQTQQGLDLQKTGQEAQIAAGNKQTIVSGVGAVGQLALGASMAYKAYGAGSAAQAGVTGASQAAIDTNTAAANAFDASAGTAAGAGAEAGGTALGTVGIAGGYAAAAVTAAHYGMPILGNWLGAQEQANYEQDPSSKFTTQAANITSYEWSDPVEAGVKDLGLPAPEKGSVLATIINPGATIVDKACCFIFISAYDGLLPIVRRYRDEHMNEKNRRGYYRIADKIVPIMEKSKMFKWLVRFFMTGPMVRYGKYFYGEGKIGIVFKPITKFWLGFFELFGKKPYIRRNGEVV